ncbi:MAG: 4Fe-4S dicluster domain-containing protein [Deltaproteobacteria bacterium]|nr:4Fe-4S dicluster domain-containing protein [Deltaproteobacteria bacterium]
MGEIPANYPPPGTSGEFVSGELQPADQQIGVGVLFVGAGPASLAGAIRLAQLLETAPAVKAGLGDFPIAIIEKGKCPGAHLLSGAVINPSAFHKLFPDLPSDQLPFFNPVPGEAVYFLTPNKAIRAPIIPPTMRNHGNYVASLSKVGQWLGTQAERLGVTILNETAGVQVLIADSAVRGVRTGDKGRDRHGKPLPNFEPGSDIVARCTVFGEGTIGHLTQAALEHFGIRRPNPQIYALGVKEVWEVPRPLGKVIHTMGWPLRLGRKWREFGGSFAYPMGNDKISLGLVVGLDTAAASLSVHDLLQEMKTHPLFRKMLEGGKRLAWGAKTIPEGGFYSLPEQLSVPGACFIGDAAGFVNVPALKGIHYAMWSGIYAAEAIFEILKASSVDNPFQNGLPTYGAAIRGSCIQRDLYRVRNMRQAFHHGFWAGSALAGLMTVTRGLFPGWQFGTKADSAQPVDDKLKRSYQKGDNQLTFDKLTSVHAAGNRSRDDQPNHLRVATKIPPVIGEAWIHMCPAAVYEWEATGPRTLRINPSNCIHCGAITAKGGRFTPPEGGSGPEYIGM